MHIPLYDHSFKTIGYKTDQSKTFVEAKLRDVAALKAKIAEEYGAESAENVIGPSIEHALRRCLQYFTKAHNVTDDDYWIFYEYAANAAIGIDNVIANEMSKP
jgi:hypothetical protein